MHAELESWAALLNQRDETLLSLYSSDAWMLEGDGEVVRGRDEVVERLRSRLDETLPIEKVDRVARVLEREGVIYEIVRFQTSDENIHSSLVILDSSDGRETRRVEFTATREPSLSTVKGDIDEARQAWMVFCNDHNARRLVESMYLDNAVYYGRRGIMTGTDVIASEYRYMNDPQYSLTLEPLHVDVVSPAFALEIGQASGSYGGKYVLVWKKTVDGWKILFDSNL